ncbi:MAG: 2-dehydro-3-deoxy-6-phosphogalactonate aldolase [Brachybacterium alimentarium]|uniref:2-dehydro-3-deoxy-6-phosphogalactonate aldolase n=1 Tax=Brachybacterium alimentarium TaxID=47845 RepID=A0A2A3YLB9_9MICO|nr:2-dehydro-3-deoxy-6-phosphogalactonate aldolase [Brachybacterium alimentarium]PCC39895.1 2-dehydro-3-deoxy-6-phosphogalactonate aldolase [Brachybacterium alimentarium]RCS69799.1 2-dehydro-3-deoxy-6-phosphogalactonate aldolase [Brachybacterium alimentarium]RCS83811.1 2-dehydro-3-deoxy-6-phosphogalactonate aldolase [Brachybacterium alimentarium]
MTSHQPLLIAILRGLTPQEAPAVGDALLGAGIAHLEVPLNSPQPFESIRILSERLGSDARIGAGTVVDLADVQRVADAGGELVVAPNTDPEIIARSLELGMTPYPGVATATDVFSALRAGARHLKIFPADALGESLLKAWSAVVPEGTSFLPVGGITTETIPSWIRAGAGGAGIGSFLYAPGRSADEVGSIGADLVRAAQGAHQREGTAL